MKYLTRTTSALILAGVVALLGGCGKNENGVRLVYRADSIDPAALDTSKQTLEQPQVAVDSDVKALAAQYDAEHAKKAAPVAASLPAAKPAPALPAPLAAKADIDAAKKRVQELRGSVKTAKNGAIIDLRVESADTTVDDMKLFAKLLDLESVFFLGNTFVDDYFTDFGALKNLKSITIQNADITVKTLEVFATLPELTQLDIRRDLKLENADLAVVAAMPKLEELHAYYNSFTNSGANKISKSTTLKIVDLRGCQDISDSAAKYLARMATLEEAYFRFGISNDGVENLAAAPALKFVELQDCLIDGTCAASLAKFPALTGLRVFRSKGFDDAGAKGIADLKLERLELRDLNVTNEGLLALKGMTTLREVEISELPIDSAALNEICASWKDLTSLNFFSVPVSDEVVATIAANMPNLKTLTLRAAVGKLTDSTIDQVLKMQNLETLDLRDNADFSIDSMMRLAQLKNLRKIYVKGTAMGDSSEAVKAKLAEFKKAAPKCAISL